MKKIYLFCSLVVVIGTLAGISFFYIRDASAQIPKEITLVTSDQKPYGFSANKKLKLVEFIYTHCPDICPTTTQKMIRLRSLLQQSGVYGSEVQFITVTIDPSKDTPEVLKTYQKSFEVVNDKEWIFLTGDPENLKQDSKEIEALANTFKFQYRDPGDGFFVHSTFTYLLDENNRSIGKFPMGEDFNEKAIFNKIKKELE